MHRALVGGLILLVSCVPPPPKSPPVELPRAQAVPAQPPLSRDPGLPIGAFKYRRLLRTAVDHKWGVRQPADLFAGQIKQESGWKPDAVSPVGAAGMGQFMPGTARDVAKLYPAELYPPKVLSANWAITALVYHDHDLYKQFPTAKTQDDRYAKMFGGYNAGPGWVRKESAIAPDPDVWIGSIENACLRRASACAETKNYVRSILFKWRPRYKGW